MKKYTTLLFDNDNTLMDFYASERQAIEQTSTAFGVEYNDSIGRLYSEINDSYWKRFEKGEIRREEIKVGRFKTFVERLSLSGDPEEMANYYFEALSNASILLEGAKELCQKLCRQYKMYLITNGSTYVQKKRLSASPITPLFKGVFISEEMGVKKPDREFFDIVLSRIEEKDKSKICVVGDSMSSDILGGINAGLDTCFFNRGDKKIYTPTYEVKSFKEMEELFYEQNERAYP